MWTWGPYPSYFSLFSKFTGIVWTKSILLKNRKMGQWVTPSKQTWYYLKGRTKTSSLCDRLFLFLSISYSQLFGKLWRASRWLCAKHAGLCTPFKVLEFYLGCCWLICRAWGICFSQNAKWGWKVAAKSNFRNYYFNIQSININKGTKVQVNYQGTFFDND